MVVSMAKFAARLGVSLMVLGSGIGAAVADDTTPPAPSTETPAPAPDVVAPPAKGAAAPTATPPAAAAPQPDVKQIKLTEDQVKHFISAQPDLAAIASKIQSAGDKPDSALQSELEGIATKHGFSTFAELDDVAANISIVMAGLDSGTGNFVDPVDALRKERDDVQKDSSIPDADKKQLMDELSEAINTTPQLQYKENVDIVKAHRAEIEKALQ